MTHLPASGVRRGLLAVIFGITLLILMGWATTDRTSAASLQQTEEADLRVESFTSPNGEVLAGRQFTYTIIVDNLGPISATNIVITDTLISSGDVDPNGCTLAIRTEGGAIDEFDCNFALSTGVFDLATLGSNHLHPRSPEDMGRIVVTINATADHATDLESFTTVTSDTPDPDLSNNASTTSLSVIEEADLRIHKFASPSPTVTAGEQFTYTIIVDNLGPSRSNNIVVTDTLVTSDFVDPNGCSLAIRTEGGAIDEFDCNFALSTGVFDLATMGANYLNPRTPQDMGRMIITINGTAEQEVVMENLTTVTADTFDPDLSNNATVTTLSVTDAADLHIQVFGAQDGKVFTGDEFNLIVVVDNFGPNPAREVEMVQELLGDSPFDITAINPDALGNQPSAQCTPAAPITDVTQQSVDCSLGDPMDALSAAAAAQIAGATAPSPDLLAAANGTSRWAIQVTLRADSPVSLTGLSSASGAQRDPSPENNIVGLQNAVACKTDGSTELGLDKQIENTERVTSGDTISYTLDFTNYSTNTAYCASVQEEVPMHTAFDASASTAGWSCIDGTPAGLPCIFDLGTLESGDSGQLIFAVTVVSGITEAVAITNTASIQTTTPEGSSDNNTSSVTVMVDRPTGDKPSQQPQGVPLYLPAIRR